MTALDLDLDALLDALEARARSRPIAPLVNAAGDEVTPLASTGRLVVHPGDIVASVWGNTTYDQTVQAYDTAASRDSQWPAPKDGAVSYTADTGTMWLRRAGTWVAVAPPARYGCRVTRVAALTSPATATTSQVILWDNKVYDQAAAFNTSTGVYTCPAAGRYLVKAQVSASIAAGVQLQVAILRNGTADTTINLFNGSAAATPQVQAVAVDNFNAGDTISASWLVGTASIGMRTPQSESHMAVDYLGPA